MAYPYTNVDDWVRSIGVPVVPWENNQRERTCPDPTVSYHCKPRASAADYGTALYDSDTLWKIYNQALPYAQGPGWVIEELFWRDLAWKRGVRIGAIPDHFSHVHIALGVNRWLPIAPPPPPKPPPIYEDLLLLDT